MTTFEDRERGMEARYSMDQQALFRATMRRNKLLGLWAAELLDIAGAEAEVYAKSVVMSDLQEPGDDDIIGKVLGDFETKGVAVTRDVIAGQLEALMPVAVEQIKAE